MTYKDIKKALMISFITALLIFSTVTGVLPVSADSSLEYLEDDDESSGPPVDVGPVIPDPGKMRRKIGGFDGRVGSFVTFETMEKGISNHSLRIGEDQYLSIFDEISIEEFGKFDEGFVDHRYTLKGNAAEVELYDSPTAILKLDVYSFEGSERHVSFKLGDMELDGEKNREKGMVTISNGLYSGKLISLDIFDHSERGFEERKDFMIENDDFINFTVEERATFIFRMEMDGFREEILEFVRERMRVGRIGAEFRIESTDEEYRYYSTSYRDVNMKAQMRDENKLDILVSSETLGDQGTLLLLDISSTVMDISSEDDIDLLFDGESADFIEDVSEIDNSDEPSYTLITGEEGTHILVNVPNFSTHSITLEYITDAIDQYLGSLTYYIPAATGSIGLVILGLVYRKYNKKEGKNKDEDGKDRRISIGRNPKNYKKDKGTEKRIKSYKKDEDKEIRVRKD